MIIKFDSGLSHADEDKIDNMLVRMANLVLEMETLGRHRNYALSITKIEEATFWLRDRRHKPAQG